MIRKRGNRWQVDVVINGERIRKGGFSSQVEAETYEKAILKGLPTNSSVTFKAFIDEHFDYLWGDTKAPQATEINCRTLLKYIKAEEPIPKITNQVIADLVQKMKADRLSNSTINRKLSTLSKLLVHAVDCELIPKRPKIPFQKEGKGRERVLERHEEERCVEYLFHIGQQNSAALFNFLLYTGCRLGEAYKVHRNNVSGGYVKFMDTKNGSNRLVPLIGPAKEGWDIVAKHTEFEYPFKVIPRDTFRDHWNRMRHHMGAGDDPDFVPHMLRHTCCTRMVRKNVNLPKVMKWMGHKSIQTTMRYTNLVANDLDTAGEALLDF
ncbi:tyrosine-type recombinase/integrase [Maritalea mediterranea]|uniref:Tyrosine-type recombinase/integrase n=1 Tax=Maritalea mediterranea TaxID=2909667 RepID=A0ABS9E9Z9_9HYPH|nr:site-specific integrase [Maritalea mediterranea]MCF4098595.1 tyrosine-type recombinase/integrase [Maritalea mediterranea]